jgi:Ner family transcriptional regulator
MMKIDIPSKQILADQKLLRGWVIYQLTLQGRSLASVAREAGVARQTIYRAFLHPYPRMEAIVAEALGFAPQQLWPARYDEHGLPNRNIGRPRINKSKKNTSKTVDKHANRCNGSAQRVA